VRIVLDIGGEGRHARAWNLNPSPTKTRGLDRGAPIPRRVAGRAEAIPFPDHSVDVIVVERTPLRAAALSEIRRVIRTDGTIILRHAYPPGFDPHRTARQVLPGRVRQRMIEIAGQRLQETVFRCGRRRCLRFQQRTPAGGEFERVCGPG
jgi:hypothetical protein